MKKIYFFFILSACSVMAKAQGYVITQHNDTIRCEVWRTTIGSAIKYRLNENSKPIRVDIDSIKEYEITKDVSRYRAVAIKKGADLQFLHVIEDGRICLYEKKTTSYSSTYNAATYTPSTNTNTTTNWYVSKDNGDLVMLKTSALINLFGASHDERKSQLADMFSDEPKVAAEYKADDSFSFSKIQKYVQEYNLGATNKTN